MKVHAPDEVPDSYINGTACKSIHTAKRRTFCGMLNAADEGIGNVSEALAGRGLARNLITVITTDNGGPNDQGPHTSCPRLSYCSGTGTSNWPLRGGAARHDGMRPTSPDACILPRLLHTTALCSVCRKPRLDLDQPDT